ncbi:hypothetical protein CRUP_006937 [Coryphaenoides rupestris]|nr:hypothetical protein CRUP_006937 [Coryphaenoides rupestris]
MTMGSRKGSTRSSLRAPKFLDKSGGFYGRLGEPDGVPPSDMVAVAGEEEAEEEVVAKAVGRDGFDANDDGATEGDDGETLLRVKLGRSSSRWRRRSTRSSGRKQQTGDATTNAGSPDGSLAPGAKEEAAVTPSAEVTAGEPTPGALVVHFAAREDADDQALDRAFRRGWEAFVTNLYSVTLTPVAASATTTTTAATTTTSSKLSSKKKAQCSIISSEFI